VRQAENRLHATREIREIPKKIPTEVGMQTSSPKTLEQFFSNAQCHKSMDKTHKPKYATDSLDHLTNAATLPLEDEFL
jgi:hypothetical protein